MAEGWENMNRIQYGNWIPGGVLRVFSQRRGVWHFGIAAGLGMVMHASKERGRFVLTTFAEFSEGQHVDYTWLPTTVQQQQAALNRAESQIGKPFYLLTANCEDYVNWIITGVARSPQRELFGVAGLVLGLLACMLG